MDKKYSTVILADGDFPSTPRTTVLLKQAQRIICCDGAAEKLLRFGLEPDAIVGDLDSLAFQLKQKFFDKIVHVAEQESNDLSKAFRYCRSKGYDDVVILGQLVQGIRGVSGSDGLNRRVVDLIAHGDGLFHAHVHGLAPALVIHGIRIDDGDRHAIGNGGEGDSQHQDGGKQDDQLFHVDLLLFGL